MLNLYKLEIFLQVAAEGSFSAAAARLLMTQSGVSQHIQDLERSLGVTLFARGPRGVRLTEAGETLHDYAQRIASLAAEAEAALTDVAQLPAGQVLIGATPGVGVYVLAEWVESFRSRYPNLTVQTQTEITPRVVAALLAGRLDVGVIEGELDDAQTTQLGIHILEEIPQVVVVGPKHPFWTRATLRRDDLAGQTWVVRQRGSRSRSWLEAALAAQGITPRIGAEFDNVESIKRAVMAGSGLTLLPDYVVRDDVALGRLRCLRIEDAPLSRTLKLVWDRRRYFAPVTRSFLRHLSARFPALQDVPGLGDRR